MELGFNIVISASVWAGFGVHRKHGLVQNQIIDKVVYSNTLSIKWFSYCSKLNSYSYLVSLRSFVQCATNYSERCFTTIIRLLALKWRAIQLQWNYPQRENLMAFHDTLTVVLFCASCPVCNMREWTLLLLLLHN